jgi:hypothetical protein
MKKILRVLAIIGFMFVYQSVSHAQTYGSCTTSGNYKSCSNYGSYQDYGSPSYGSWTFSRSYVINVGFPPWYGSYTCTVQTRSVTQPTKRERNVTSYNLVNGVWVLNYTQNFTDYSSRSYSESRTTGGGPCF